MRWLPTEWEAIKAAKWPADTRFMVTPLLAKARRGPSLTSLERAALGALGSKGRDAEAVAAELKLPSDSVSGALLQLVAKGLADDRDGVYRRRAEA